MSNNNTKQAVEKISNIDAIDGKILKELGEEQERVADAGKTNRGRVEGNTGNIGESC